MTIFSKSLRTAVVSFREIDGRPIKLVSELCNSLHANIYFKIMGVTLDELESPTYLLPDGRRCGLKNALLQIMMEENFHNFYPDLIALNPEGGVYAGSIIKRHLIARLKRMRPDLQSKRMFVETVVLTFTPVPSEKAISTPVVEKSQES